MRTMFFLILAFGNILLFAQDTLQIKINKLRLDYSNLELEIKLSNEKLSSIKSEIEQLEKKKLLTQLSISGIKRYYAILNSNGTLRDEGEKHGFALDYINSGDSVELLGYADDYWFVKWNDITGYLARVYLNESETTKAVKELFIKKNQERLKLEIFQDEKNQQEYKNRLIKKYGKTNGERVYNGYYWIGMTDEMAIESIGKPLKINKTVGSWGVHEQWVYNYDLYLYFENGILESFQNSN